MSGLDKNLQSKAVKVRVEVEKKKRLSSERLFELEIYLSAQETLQSLSIP